MDDFYSDTRGAIVFLAPPDTSLPHRESFGRKSTNGDVDNFIHSLRLLKVNYHNAFPCPVLVFVEEGRMRSETIALLRDVGIPLTFVPISFDIPDFLDASTIPAMFQERYTVGYRHMCRFFSGAIYRHPAMAKFDYYWRLDTDSFITSPVKYDIFRYMEKNGLSYGYRHIPIEDASFVNGLWEAHCDFVKDRQIQPEFLDKFTNPDGSWNLASFYTNFEVSRLAFWRSPAVQDHFDFLDRKGGIYEQRWGDAPIHALAVATFMPLDQVHEFSGFGYNHEPLNITKWGHITSWTTWIELKPTLRSKAFKLLRVMENAARSLRPRHKARIVKKAVSKLFA